MLKVLADYFKLISIFAEINRTMKKYFLPLAILFLLYSSSVFAQSTYKTHGLKCKATKIIDPGEMYSTISFSEEDEANIRKAVKNSDLAEDIFDLHTESTWPDKMKDLDNRTSELGKATIVTYKVFKVCEVDGKIILVIPVKGNSGMPRGYVPDHDFYMVIGIEGVK